MGVGKTNASGMNTADATAIESEILLNETAYVNNQKIIGTMPNNGSVGAQLIVPGDSYTIPAGYHNGSGTVSPDVSSADAVAAEVLEGKKIFSGASTGVITGTMTNRGSVGAQTLKPGNSYTIPAGYHNGNGIVSVDVSETTLAQSNARSGYYFYNASGQKVQGSMSTYTGNTSVTPSTSSQTLSTSGKYIARNISVGAIPSEYKKMANITSVGNDTDTLTIVDSIGFVPSVIFGFAAYSGSGTLTTYFYWNSIDDEQKYDFLSTTSGVYNIYGNGAVTGLSGSGFTLYGINALFSSSATYRFILFG